mgnify:FL=1
MSLNEIPLVGKSFQLLTRFLNSALFIMVVFHILFDYIINVPIEQDSYSKMFNPTNIASILTKVLKINLCLFRIFYQNIQIVHRLPVQTLPRQLQQDPWPIFSCILIAFVLRFGSFEPEAILLHALIL